MNPYVYLKKDRKLLMTFVYFFGFIGGILLMNILWKIHIIEGDKAAIYVLDLMMNECGASLKYWIELLKIRYSVLILYLCSGLSIFGVPVSILMLLLSGFETGAFLTLSILSFGNTGGIAGIFYFMPHMLLYVPINIYMANAIYHISKLVWEKNNLLQKEIVEYGKTVVCINLAYFVAVMTEAWIHPDLFEKILEIINFYK